MIEVCFTCEKFTQIRDTTCHGKPEEWGCSHKIYTYGHSTAESADWFSLEKGEGFEYIPPKITDLPDEGHETAAGNDYRARILQVYDAEHIEVDTESLEVVTH